MGVLMKSKKTKDYLENKETLDFLIKITELLNESDALIGRNDEMFALDTSKVPQLLADANKDLHNLFMDRKLILDQENSFGLISIITASLMDNEILFFDVADSISKKNHNKNESYPLLNDVHNWFLSIPKFSESERIKYEKIYKMAKEKMKKIMHEHADEFIKAILFGTINDNSSPKKKSH
jgi:hypothetical protein